MGSRRGSCPVVVVRGTCREQLCRIVVGVDSSNASAAALDWAVANDDAETALMIAGGAAWPYWLTGMVVEGRRWLEDAFACPGEADERTRALALATW